jgi:(R)-2-hydroxyacyl-CoA dehydratese activating ATPase
MAKRTLGLVSRVGKCEPMVMTGGVARNPAAVRHIEDALGCKLVLPERPQIAGALGAALFALDDFRKEGASRRQADLAIERDLEGAEEALRSCKPACGAKVAAL